MNKFPCTSCGACCRKVKQAHENLVQLEKKYPSWKGVSEFPYSWDENGKCSQLTEDNKCAVYEDRPLMCNVDRMAEYFDMPKQEFYGINIAACNQLIDEEGLDESLRIKY